MCHLLRPPFSTNHPSPLHSCIRLEAGRKRECRRIQKHVLVLLSASALTAGKRPKLFIRLHAAVCMYSTHSKVTPLKHQSEILWPVFRAPSLQIDQTCKPTNLHETQMGVSLCIIYQTLFSSMFDGLGSNIPSPIS